jgi:hypothetical protein
MASEIKHTPGPWLAGFNDVPYAEHDGIAWTVDAEIGGICMVDGPADCNEANARLIAAAPELLQSLQTAMQWIKAWDVGFLFDEEWADDEVKIKAAIARATGAAS